MDRTRETRKHQRGSALIEFLLLFPIVFFLFVGAVDMGFYCYALISVQNATRVAALYTSSESSVSADSTGACQYVLKDLAMMPNSSQLPSGCSALPLKVSANQ